jgi:hypothetical protein
MHEHGTLMECYSQGKPEVLEEKLVATLLDPTNSYMNWAGFEPGASIWAIALSCTVLKGGK